MKSINPYRSLKARLGLAIAGIALVLSILVSLVVGYTTSDRMEANIGSSLAELAYQMADKLDRGMFERYRDIQIITSLEAIKNPDTPAAAKRELLEKLQSTYPDYAWIGLTDKQGKVLVSTGKVLEGKDARSRPWFQNGQNGSYVGDVHAALLLAKIIPHPRDEPLRLVDVAAPVSFQGEFQGVLAAHLNWTWAREVEKSLLQAVEKHNSLEVLILGKDGTVLLGSPEQESQKLNLESVKAAIATQNRYVVETWNDGTYLTGFARSQGYRNYPGLGWLVLLRQKSDIAFAPVRSLERQIFILTMTLGVMLAIVGWSIADRLAKPMLAIAFAADRIRQGDTTIKIPIIRGKDQLAIVSRSLNQLVRTLTEQEQALQESFSILHSVIEGSTDAIFMKDLQGRYLTLNSTTADMIGKPVAEIVGKDDTEVFPLEIARQIQEVDRRIINSEIGEMFEESVLMQGELRTLFTAKTVCRNEQGKVIGIVGIARDISDRKRAEEKIKQLNQDLERRVIERTAQLEVALQELEAFSYSVSHDLRAPLRSIDGFSLALMESYGEQLDEEGKNYLQRVRKATQRMGELIDDLLYLSRITCSDMHWQTVNLSQMVGAIAIDLQQMQSDRIVEFAIAPHVIAQGDSRLLKILFENLLSNAMKFTGKKLSAKIEFGTTSQPDNTTIYFVRDNGAGFDMDYAMNLFAAFGRLHSASEFPGTGIGLATVKRIVHRHGGRIWAEGTVGLGATFYFTLSDGRWGEGVRG